MNAQAWIEALGWTLVHFLWQGLAVATLLWVFIQFAFRARPQVRYLAACGSLLLLIALAGTTFLRESAKTRAQNPGVEFPSATSKPAYTAPSTPKDQILAPTDAAPISSITASEIDHIATAPPAARSLSNYLESSLPGIVAVWTLGVSFGFLRLGRSWRKIQKIRRSGQSLNEAPWPISFARLCLLFDLTHPIRLVTSAAVQVPIVIGWLKPIILLPCTVVTGLTREQVEAIIAHELAHIRRHDYLVNVLQTVVETLFFFHPAVWWISGHIRREREHCCDDLAAAACGGALPYVTALTALEGICGAEQPLTVAASGGSLLDRVRRLLAITPSEGPGAGPYLAGATLLILIASVALPLAFAQAPKTAPPAEEAPQTPDAETSRHAAAIPGHHAQTRSLLGLWRVEFHRPPYFAIALNQKVQRKSSRGKAVDGAGPRSDDISFKNIELRTPPIPAEAFQRLAKHIDQYIERFPGENAEKLRAFLPKLRENKKRPLEEAAALLDEIGDTAALPVSWLVTEEESRALERRRAKEARTANGEKNPPFGPKSPVGLRAAWIFRPAKDEYAIGDALASRVIIHNAGTRPVEFITNEWLQDAQWSVLDANGHSVTLTKTRYARAEERRSRLAPGESLELPAFGLGIGVGEFDHVYEDGPIAMKLPARAGDEFRCKWEVNIQAAWTLGDDEDAAKPAPVKLETGEVKFRVVDHPAEGPKPLGIATKGGFYVISPGVKLRITRLRVGPPIIIVNGREKLPSTGDRKEVRESNSADLELAADRSKRISVRLPDGDNSYVIAWERGGTTLWVGEADWVRKLDISAVGRFPAAELLETTNPLEREEVEKLLQNAGTGVPEQRWKWEDPGDFGGIPAHVKAALIQHRPKADANTVAPEATYPVDAADPRLPWHASGQVRDSDGKPMADVEIWVHTGSGSLMRTGFAKTDASGRYTVKFGPGVLMEKESAQLQFANITAHRPGFFEKNLSRHGQGAAATRDVDAESLKDYGITAEQLTLPNRPRHLDFVMLPAATVRGKLLGSGFFPSLPPQDYRGKEGEKLVAGYEQRNRSPLARWKIWLTGPKLPPGCGVFASAETDHEGRFEFKDVPAGFEWQIQADTHHRSRDPRSPLFKVNASESSTLEVELDEKQTGLKILPAAAKPGAARSPSFDKPEVMVFAEGAGPVTPLMSAADAGNLQEVQRLLAAGENPNARTDDRSSNGALIGGITPLYAAAVRGRVEVVKALLDGGADVRGATTANGRFPLFEIIHSIPSEANLEAMMKLLLQRGADPNQPNRKIGSALHFAVVQKKPAVVRLLVEGGANLSAETQDGKTPLDLARQHNLQEIVDLLKEFESKKPR